MSDPIITTIPSPPRPPTQPAPTGVDPTKPSAPTGLNEFGRGELSVWVRRLRIVITESKDRLLPDTLFGGDMDIALKCVEQLEQVIGRPGTSAPLPPLTGTQK